MTFSKFLFVGAGAAVLQFLTLAFLLEVVELSYKIAATFAYIASVIFHFFANKYFTFDMLGSPRFKEVARYLTIVVINCALTIGVTTLSVETFLLGAYIGTFLSILSTILIGYLGSKYWIFINKG